MVTPDPYWSRSVDLALFDVSGTLGYGIFYAGHWIADTWPPPLQGRSIQWKEFILLPLPTSSGVIRGQERKSSFTVTIRQWLISGLLALPETPISRTLFAQYFPVVLLKISQS